MFADNPGGGGSGDTPELLRAIIESNIPGTAAAVICDPETVQKALKIGVGNIGSFTIAGKAEPAYGLPIVAEAKVKAIADGNFIATGPMGRGNPWDMGVCARLEVGNVDILVCSTRIACNDADIFRHLGVEPSQKKLLLIKSRGHFRASFEPLASSIIEVDAPGAANPNLKRYSYQKIAAWPLNVK
jgi:microcystin degradation protein MlrC